MGIRREFLMIGGPLHAEVQLIDQHAAVDNTGPLGVASASIADQYPPMWTDIRSASNYVQRTVAHMSNATGETYGLTVYVWEGVNGMQDAQMLLGDGVMHRYFLEHGQKAPTPTNGVAQENKLIVPGQ